MSRANVVELMEAARAEVELLIHENTILKHQLKNARAEVEALRQYEPEWRRRQRAKAAQESAPYRVNI